MSAARETVFLASLAGHEGEIEADLLTEAFHVTKEDLAATTGLPKAALYRTSRRRGRVVQTRLRETAEVVNRILPWCGGSVTMAYAWYRSQPIPAFGDQTAADLVRHGRSQDVMSYLAGLAVGGYA
jgi:hypothetical protein